MFNKKRFKLVLIEQDIKMEAVASFLDINPATLSRKINGGTEFTRAEMQKLIKMLSLTAEDVKNIFFAD